MFTLPFELSAIPVENPAPSSPVLGPTMVESWTVPSNPFKLTIVSMLSAQYPTGMLTLPGLAEIVKSGVVARTGLARPMVPSAISVNSTTTIVPERKPFRNRFASSIQPELEPSSLDT